MHKERHGVVMSWSFHNKLIMVLWWLVLVGATEVSAAPPIRIALDARAALRLKAHWAQMQSGHAKFDQHPEYGFYYKTRVHVPTRLYGVQDLRVLLPAVPVSVGDVWKIEERQLHRFFSQFHPGVLTRLHNGGPDGAYALLRAVSSRYLEIAFRFHVEFELKAGSIYYTPAQFTGYLLVDRKTQSPVALRWYVPTHHSLNVDLNAGRAIDAVFVSRMELVGGAIAHTTKIRWQQSLSWSEARLRLSRQFYAFMSIAWYDVTTGLQTAKQQKKPIHLFVVFGSLDDQSC